ncbi:MAG: transcription antitermination factor NusB [Chloroflexi bacterium]|nr:transcription antitermination factor NusB [Chloroflexota bacterium]
MTERPTWRRPREPRGGRHPARRLALQTLFEIDLNRGADAKATWERGVFRAGLNEAAGAFAWEIVQGVTEHRKELDEEIGELAPEFPIDQMPRIDRNVLRIALYELRYAGDAPASVIIDEAVELAKMFGSEASAKFVNGVLATAVGGKDEGS